MSDQISYPEIPGENFIKAMYYLIHTIRIHQDNNQMVRDSVSHFKGLLDGMTDKEDVTLQLWRGRFHIQGEKIPFRRETVHVINEMAEYFTDRGIGGLFFPSLTSQAPSEEIVFFARLLNESMKHENPREWLEHQVKKRGVVWAEILKKQDENTEASNNKPRSTKQERGRKVYFEALETLREVAEKASQGTAGARKVRRIAQAIVDLVHEDWSLILGLANIKNYDDYTYTHSVNVTLIATCLGRHIGLSRVSLEHLSVCSLLHDLGKVGIPKEVLLKEGQLSPEEWDHMQLHPLIGIRKILRLNAPKELRSRIILGPFEHHLNPNMSGYPKIHFMKRLSLLGKIIRIADVYEALTADRAYRPRSFTPAEALRKMLYEDEKSFDPLLLKSFIHMMGVYPVGSIVRLGDGRIGIVMDYPDESRKTLPIVQILVDDGTGNFSRGESVYLADQDPRNGSSRLCIIHDIHPSSLGIQVSEFFIEEGSLRPV